MSGFDVEIREVKKTWKTALMWAVVVYAVLSAIFSAYFSVFEVGIRWEYALVILGTTIPIQMILLWNSKYRIRKTIGVLIALVLVSVVLYEKVYAGAAIFINRYIELYNKYYLTNMAAIIAEADQVSTLLVLWLIGTIFATILLYVLSVKKGMLLSVAVILTPVIISAIVGKMPSTVSGWGLIASTCFYLIAYHHRELYLPYREWTSAACVLVVLFVISSAVQPVITEYKNENIEKYKEIKDKITKNQQFNLDQFKESVSSVKNGTSDFGGGVSKGQLKNLTSFHPTGETAMEIVVSEKPLQTIYLKAFVGSKYTGESWEEIGTFEFAEMISPIGGEAKKRALMNEPFRRVHEGTSGYSAKHMEINLLNASAEFAYTPYYAQITDDYNVHLDSYVEGGWSKKRQYDYYTETPADTDSLLSEASNLWLKYQEFVEETYVGEYNDLEQLNELCQNLDDSSVAGLSSDIYYMFNSAFAYSRNPGAMPDDTDFIEGFLFQRKTGFCVHFATAATLIYQISGIPARYVEGYAVTPDQFTRDLDGTYKAVVTDADAHAWCEIFDDETGWYPKEFTPSYGEDDDEIVQNVEDNPENNEDIQEENPPEDEPQNEPEDDTQQQEEDADDNNTIILPGNENNESASGTLKIVKEVFLKCGAAIFGVLFVLVIVVLSHKVRRRRKLKSFRQRKENRGILKIYNEIYNLCVFAGLKVSEESEKEKVRKMAEMFSVISKEQWSWIYDIAEKSAFSGKVFSAEEQKEMYHLYQKLRRDILKNLNWKKKMWFLYGKAM